MVSTDVRYLKDGYRHVGNLLIQFVPLAAGAIAPVMIMAVILVLSAEGGLPKAFAFILGRFVAYAIWGILLLSVSDKLSDGSGGTSTGSLVVKAILGLLLLVMAARNFVGEDDPDAPPPKWMAKLNSTTPLALFGIAMVLSVVQLRYVALMMSGVTSIVDADLSSGLVVVALILLVLVVILPQLAPILVYLVMGKGAESVLTSMNVWLTRNQRMVNVVVLGLFGAVLLAQSLPELWG
ncbi:MAG: hypothetical protein GKR86_07005 [Ilumatobacter sp.]|nr:hypothetical protein [Ilumatobacter sp.]